jgi:hypothetical protein
VASLADRERVTLLAALRLLEIDLRTKPKAGASQLLTIPEIQQICRFLRSGERKISAIHRHVTFEGRVQEYLIIGLCSQHGTLCLGCEMNYEHADGPLRWCRECDLIVEEA